MPARAPESPPPEVAAALADLAASRPDVALRVRWYRTLPSTMDFVTEAAHAGAAAGLVVVAEEQTAGRGRRGHTWVSPPGAGLYFSYLARPRRDAGLVTLAAGVAVRSGVAQATGLTADLKWPNDLLVGSRKLAGLLAEGVAIGTPAAAVTIGVGINLRPAAYPLDVAARATSIDGETGREVDAGAVLAAVLEHLHDTLASLDRGNAGDILQQWRRASPTAVGTRVTWTGADQPRQGLTAGIDETGALLVRTPTGHERIVSGELAWDLPSP
jgi:BirA family transcriptional regulator, biotin operon repressor / biotin---[acetyl-CoA-carboxylase] ligase